MTSLSNPPARPQSARLFCAPGSLAWPLALIPAWAAWHLTGDLGSVTTTLMVVFGAAWQISFLLRAAPAVSNRTARLLSAALFVGIGWQLAWVPFTDFWLYRAALPLWGAAWLILWWGPSGLVWGWRVLTAFLLWGYCADGPWQWARDGYQVGDSIGPALSVFTAQAAGRLMWYGGSPVIVRANVITLHGNAVSVGIPCTALPLIKLLWLLLVLAALLFRIRLVRTLRLGVIAALMALVVSIGRVIVLVQVVGDPARFHYWHDAGQGGSEWFTAAAMLVLAWFTARAALAGYRPAETPERTPTESPFAIGRWALFLGGAGAVSIGAALASPAPRAHFPASLPGPDHFRIVSQSENWFDPGMDAIAEPNQPAAAKITSWANSPAQERLDVVAAYVPRRLAIQPLTHDAIADAAWNGRAPAQLNHATWTADASGRVLSARAPGLAAWCTTVRPPARSHRWLAWFLHRRPARDTQSFWLEAIWMGPAGHEPATPPSAFLAWSSTLQSSLP